MNVVHRIRLAAFATAWAFVVPTIARADALADRLGPHVGQTLDLVELGTGRRFVRPTLEGVVEKRGQATGLRLRAEGETTVTSVSLSGVAKIVAGRETIHESASTGKVWSQIRGRRAKEVYDQAVAESVARMKAHGTEPWPVLSAAEHAAEVESLGRFVEDVRAVFPGLAITETHEFLVASDIPAAQLVPYVASLDAMHDFLCDLYGIPRGEPLWKGKCLVVAFLREDDYVAFEGRFMQTDTRGTHGMCHQRSDGRVVVACHRGNDATAFAHMIVHETSHGFNHRWMSPEKLPNWLNEGIAEWVGARVVKNCDQVPLKEAHALVAMRSEGDLGPGFFTAANIQPVQYGMASGLVKLLVSRDAKKFATLVRSIKEGTPAEEALQESFGGSLDDLVRAYGAAVGVPGLRQRPE
jgi:hypothetical protein